MKQRNQYIDRDKLHQLMRDYKDNGIISEQLGQMFIQMTDHILGHSNFRNYTVSLKEEMKSHSLLMLVKYSHNCNAYERDSRQTFNYITTIIFNACKQILIKYYKQENLKRELERQYLDFIESTYGVKIKSEFIDNFEYHNILDKKISNTTLKELDDNI